MSPPKLVSSMVERNIPPPILQIVFKKDGRAAIKSADAKSSKLLESLESPPNDLVAL